MTGSLAGYLCPDGYAGPRGLRPLLAEARVAREVLHAGHLACWRTSASGTAERPVLLIPGFIAGDFSLRSMSGWLRTRGYRTYRSHIHSNVACTRSATDRLEQRLAGIAERQGAAVALVGHSLGGLQALALARRRPDLVSDVITLGSPHLAPGAVHLVLRIDLAVLAGLRRAGLTSVMGADCIGGECAQLSWRELAAGPPTDLPFTSLYSCRDGIIDWRSCLHPAARHVEVGSSHLGMAVDRSVWGQVDAALAATADGVPLRAVG